MDRAKETLSSTKEAVSSTLSDIKESRPVKQATHYFSSGSEQPSGQVKTEPMIAPSVHEQYAKTHSLLIQLSDSVKKIVGMHPSDQISMEIEQSEPVLKSILDCGEKWVKPAEKGVSLPNIPVDIIEYDEEIQLWAEVPGVDKENIHVSITTNDQDQCGVSDHQCCHLHKGPDDGSRILRIELEKPLTKFNVGNPKFIRKEQSFGKTCRCLLLPTNIDQAHISSMLSAGILRIRLPKLKGSSGMRVPIEAVGH